MADPFKKMISVSLSAAQSRVMHHVLGRDRAVFGDLLRRASGRVKTIDVMEERGLIEKITVLNNPTLFYRATEWGKFVFEQRKKAAEKYGKMRFIRSRGT